VEETRAAQEREKERWVNPLPTISAKTRKHIRHGRTKIFISFAIIILGIIWIDVDVYGIIIGIGAGLLIAGLIQYAYGKHRESKEEEEREGAGWH
jgi:hypothetical protein